MIMNNGKFARAVCLFFVSINLFDIFGLTASYYQQSIIWKMASLACLVIYILYANRRTELRTSHVLLFLSYVAIEFAIVIHGYFSGFGVTFDPKEQIIPIIYLATFLVMLGNYKMSTTGLRRVNILFILTMVFAALYNIVMNIGDITSFLDITNSYQVSFSSFYDNRNTFGFFMGFASIITIFNLKSEKIKSKRTLYILCLLLFILSLLLTLSRAPLVMLILFFIIYSIRTINMKSIFKLMIILSICILALLHFVGGEFINDNLIRSEAGSTGRDGILDYGKDIYLSNNLLIGSGYNTPFVHLEADLTHSTFHNAYLTTLITGGIAKFILYITILITSLRTSLKLRRYNKDLSMFFIALLVGYVVYGLFESSFLLQSTPGGFVMSLYLLFIPIYMLNYVKHNSSINTNSKTSDVKVKLPRKSPGAA